MGTRVPATSCRPSGETATVTSDATTANTDVKGVAVTTGNHAPMIAATSDHKTITTPDACAMVVGLIRKLASVRGEREVFRQMLGVTLTQLHEQDRELERERQSRYRLLDELRAIRNTKQGKAAS